MKELWKRFLTFKTAILVLSFLLGSIVPLNAQSELKELCELNEKKTPRLGENFPIEDASGNFLFQTAEYDIVKYYAITCGTVSKEYFIEFPNSPKKITSGSFAFLGKRQFGNKMYWEIKTSPKDSLVLFRNGARISQRNQVVSKQATVKNLDIYQNPNLLYFKSLAIDPNRRREAPSDLVIFFDHSCPLVFQKQDSQFYWDQSIAYRFEISCTRDTSYGSIQIPANKNGSLVVNNTEAKNLKPGDRFFAKVVLKKITNEQAFWSQPELYYE